ncbi:MAG TPA: c-type cytochrome [Syntrophomonadaceae bacterium]|nr:c-type cytochrome [Syntrophomonadaceae bacterium]
MKRIALMLVLSIVMIASVMACSTYQNPAKKPYTQTPAINPPVQVQPAQTSGMEIYRSKCLVCHGDKGQGVKGQGSTLLTTGGKDPQKVMAVTKNGTKGMPAYKSMLSDTQITDVSNYVTNVLNKKNIQGK